MKLELSSPCKKRLRTQAEKPPPFYLKKINKLRQIITPLLDTTSARKSPRAEHLSAFLAALTKLERCYFYNTTTFSSEDGGGGGPSLSAEVMARTEEEQEAECWAELRAVEERWMEVESDRSKQSG